MTSRKSIFASHNNCHILKQRFPIDEPFIADWALAALRLCPSTLRPDPQPIRKRCWTGDQAEAHDWGMEPVREGVHQTRGLQGEAHLLCLCMRSVHVEAQRGLISAHTQLPVEYIMFTVSREFSMLLCVLFFHRHRGLYPCLDKVFPFHCSIFWNACSGDHPGSSCSICVCTVQKLNWCMGVCVLLFCGCGIRLQQSWQGWPTMHGSRLETLNHHIFNLNSHKTIQGLLRAPGL